MAAGYSAGYGDVTRASRSRLRRAASTRPSASHIAPPAGLPLTPQPQAPTLPGPLLPLAPPLPVALVARSPPLPFPLPLEVAVAVASDPDELLAFPPDPPLPPAPPPPLLAPLLIAPPTPVPLALPLPLAPLLAELLAVVLLAPQTPLPHVPPGHAVPSGSAGVEHVPLCTSQVPAA
jgi:hypothetical protein